LSIIDSGVSFFHQWGGETPAGTMKLENFIHVLDDDGHPGCRGHVELWGSMA
jgi:hypothetical protein